MSDDSGHGAPRASRARRLATARSAYLRGASEQPIDWYPWGPEPFALAERRDVPVLLDIGAVWCHWCHVMDEGTYADPEVARMIGQHFVAVKVDRDEHPEVDRRYQRQVSALTGQGGWPLTGFLTPRGETFLGGTYFPPQDGHGRPGFVRVLKEVARIWSDERAKALANVRAVAEALERHEPGAAPSAPVPHAAFLARTREQLHQSYDPVNGGFGFAPKFPHPTAVAFLLYDGFARGDATSLARARETLHRMADGGLYDHLGGGFHRYATDEGWHIPHFEKMAADNSALLAAYVEGARQFGDERFLETIRGTLSWLDGTLADPRGGWGASQDADNAPGDDGGYFTWSRTELRDALDHEEFRLVQRFFGIGSDGRMPHDPERNVLYRLLPLAEAASGQDGGPERAAERLRSALAKLRAVRAARPAPFVDRALYADLNGGFVRAVAMAGELLDDASLVARARGAADRFLREAYDPERGVAHVLGPDGPSGFGHLEDQAWFALGLVELAGVTTEGRYVEAADQLLALVAKQFAGPDGRLRDLAPRIYDGPIVGSLATPSYPVEDNPHLAPAAAVALALVRRAALGGSDGPLREAQRLLEGLVPRVEGAGLFGAGTALAVGLLATPPARVVIEGDGPEADRLLKVARSTGHPNRWVFRGHPAPPFSLPFEVTGSDRGSPARALVCFGTACLAPITDPARLAAALRSGSGGPP